MNRIEINCQTGEQTVVPLTEEEIAEIEAREPQPAPVAVDPVEKLRAFLADNPDVQAILE